MVVGIEISDIRFMNSQYYQELSVEIFQEYEDLWSTFCFEANASGIETLSESGCQNVDDRVAVPSAIQPNLPEQGPNELTIVQRIFFEDQDLKDIETLPDQFCRIYEIPPNKIVLLELKNCPYEDWQSGWKEYFQPIHVGESFIICPPWEVDNVQEVGQNKIPIIIDPGQGFGTGYHPSTVLALETLERTILQSKTIPLSMVDVGIGSGILSFAAAHLGVLKIQGVDIDSAAVEDVNKNKQLNGFDKEIEALVGEPNSLQSQFTIVISNMLSRELLSVKEDLVRLVEPNGKLICSGFLDKQWSEIRSAFEELGMITIQLYEKDQWHSVIMEHRFSSGV